MQCGDQTLKGIIDWSLPTNFTVNISSTTVKGWADPAPASTPTAPPDPGKFWDPGNARFSIAKNDPRVHFWYGPYRDNAVTINGYGVTGANNGRNPNITAGGPVDFKAGDIENYHTSYAPNANYPEYRSNFVIAERGMQSIGELGFVHTGRPWRSLSLQRYGAQPDERQTGSSIPKPPYDITAIPDWAILDIFTVNTPPIYGRVNINNGGWHLGNYTASTYIGATNPSFEDLPTWPQRPNLLADWRDAISQWYGGVGQQWPFYTLRTSAYNLFRYAVLSSVASSQKDAASLPVAAALNVIPQYQFRNLLANYITHRATNMVSGVVKIMEPYLPYVTPAQICDVPYMTNLFTSVGTQVAYTDADKEDTLRRIINVLTTHGDAFTVYVVGNADGGEARLMAVVERVYDPGAVQIIDKNKFRIRQVRWNSD
jgi:hypothetical protein